MRDLLLFIALVLISGVSSALAQDDEVIKLETRLVSVPVIVSDRDGRYVGGLTQKDFAVFQDGVRQPIEFFAATDEPLTIAVLIDTSHSTRPVLDDIKDAAKAFIKLLGPRDQAMIVCFDHEVHVLNSLTGDQAVLRRAIKDATIPDEIGTVMRDAIDETIFKSFDGLSGRKAIIVLTDGRDGGSHITKIALLRKLQETDTLVYTVQFRTEERRLKETMLRTGRFPRNMGSKSESSVREEEKTQAAADGLNLISLVTAGRFYSSEAGDLKKTFGLIVDELRRQYRLGFYPPDGQADTALHQIKVGVARSGVSVRARGNYRLEAPK